MNYSELLQLAKGWSNFIFYRTIIWRLLFERATIRGIADYLLFGTGPDKEERDYEERMDEIYQRLETAVAKYDSNPNSELLDLCNELTSETASVYMEIGLQVGILLMQEIKENKDREN